MPSLNLEVPHALDQEEATRRLKDRFGQIKEKHAGQISDLEERWNGNTLDFSFKTFGIRVKGTAVSGPSEVKVQTQLPLAAMMFKGTIEQQLGDELRSLLG
jgi:putative polyhydroxyalkanoic acid system protein